MTPAGRQTMLFSATMPGADRRAGPPLHDASRRTSARSTRTTTATTVKAIEQFVYRAHAMDKVEMLARILQAEGRGLTMVFCRTKRTAAKVADELADRGFAAGAVHGDLGQGAREQALRAFRNGKVDVLVATDVAARGIDVEDVTHVINYQCPEDEKTYLHRIGRTGRAGATGIAVTFVDWDDMPRWGLINKALDLGIPEPAETYSTSEHLYADLDIPRRHHRAAAAGRSAPAPAWTPRQVEDLGETGKSSGRAAPPAAATALPVRSGPPPPLLRRLLPRWLVLGPVAFAPPRAEGDRPAATGHPPARRRPTVTSRAAAAAAAVPAVAVRPGDVSA